MLVDIKKDDYGHPYYFCPLINNKVYLNSIQESILGLDAGIDVPEFNLIHECIKMQLST